MDPSKPLDNPRHEAFAHAVAMNECSGAEAYRRHVSGGKCSEGTAAVSACNMLKAGSNVALRVEAIRAATAKIAEKKFALSREKWLARFIAIADKAEEAGDYAAAKGCLREIGLATPDFYTPTKVDAAVEIVIQIGQ